MIAEIKSFPCDGIITMELQPKGVSRAADDRRGWIAVTKFSNEWCTRIRTVPNCQVIMGTSMPICVAFN